MRSPESLDIAAQRINKLRDNPARCKELLTFLDESADIYLGRGAQDTDRLRAYALVAIAETPHLSDLGDVITETLELGQNPLMIAAAARAACQLAEPPEDVGNLLIDAAKRLCTSDRKVWFDTISQAPRPELTQTAISEILDSFHHIQPASEAAIAGLKDLQSDYGHYPSSVPAQRLSQLIARFEERLSTALPSCCGCASTETTSETDRPCPEIPESIWDINMQDQTGREAVFGDFVKGLPTVLGFFYTRCLNPEKCSRTINQLAELHRLAAEETLNILAVSYDPAWDNPKRLHIYGKDRGFAFSPTSRFIRNLDRWEEIIEGFDLSVGYGPTTVNRHQIDLFLLDAKGKAVKRWPQRKWTAQEVYDALPDSRKANG